MQTNLTVERAQHGRNTHDQAKRSRGSTLNLRGSTHKLLASNASAQSSAGGVIAQGSFNEKRIVKGGVSSMRVADGGRGLNKSCKYPNFSLCLNFNDL